MQMLQYHDYAIMFPPMSEEDMSAMKEDIKINGIHTPIVLHENKILDGRHRYEAAIELGIPEQEIPTTTLSDGVDPLAYALSANCHRRHLNTSQRAMASARLSSIGASELEITHKNKSDLFNISVASVAQAEKVIKFADESIINAVDQGDVSVSDAAKIAEMDHEIQKEILDDKKNGKTRTLAGRAEAKQTAERERNKPDPPEGSYRVVVIDPPWERIKNEVRPKDNINYGDYSHMNDEEVAELEFSLADDAWVFLWTTQDKLESAFRILNKWNLEYRFTMVWHKSGGPQLFTGSQRAPQSNCEFVLAARQGDPGWTDTADFSTCFYAKRTGDSRKPDEFYSLLKRVTQGPRLDMFARGERDGFDIWGAESKC